MQEWLAGLVDAVPDFTAFPLVDELVDQLEELASRYPDVASLIRAGTSRLGEPITALRVESGPREALVFGGVHPNEPIGGLTALHLARALCAAPELRQRLSYSWTVVPCIDPDGMRLNEGWFKGPSCVATTDVTSTAPPAKNRWSGPSRSGTRKPISTLCCPKPWPSCARSTSASRPLCAPCTTASSEGPITTCPPPCPAYTRNCRKSQLFSVCPWTWASRRCPTSSASLMPSTA